MKKILLLAVMAATSVGAFAQGGEKGPFLTNKFGDNWFISAGGGANLYLGERDFEESLRFAPAIDISLGKWFTPTVGARLQYAGLGARGWSNTATAPFVDCAKATSGLYPEKFAVNFVHADFLWNVSNMLGGYKQDRRWQFVPFAGFGAAMSSVKETKNYEVALAAGLINKVRISDALDANLEFRGMLVNQGFDGVVGGKPIEGMGSVTVGLSYKFNKRGFDKPQTVAPADYTPYNDRIKALEGELVAANEKAARVARELEAARGATAGKSVEIVLPQTAVFFNIGSAELSEKELVNIGYLAAAINKMPAGRKLKLIGNADSATGSDKRNMELSEQRARAVHKALVAAGVDPARLEVVANGSSKEPFEKGKPALNRVLIAE